MGMTEDQQKYIERVLEARLSCRKSEENIKSGGKAILQEEVAKAIGVDRSTYANYERIRPMPQKYISKFCDYLNINTEWLLYNRGPMERGSKNWVQNQADFISGLAEEERTRYEEGLKFMFPDKFRK